MSNRETFLQKFKSFFFPALAKSSQPSDALRDLKSSTPETENDFSSDDLKGVQKNVAVLYIDLKGFAKISTGKPPHIVVGLLNEFFEAVGKAVQQSGGWVDQYMGDGLLAIFGHNTTVENGCLQAFDAAKRIDYAIQKVNSRLSRKIKDQLDVGMGLHVGPLIMGRIGQRDKAYMTTIGPAVNIACRLEELTLEKNCQLITTYEAVETAKLSTSLIKTEYVLARGINIPIEVVCVPLARQLSQYMNTKTAAE